MKYQCEEADFSFIKKAKFQYKYSAKIPASAETVFKIFENEHAWPLWFKGVRRIQWTSEKPFKVGTTRTVYLKNGFSANEVFYAWKPGREFGFYFTDTNVPSLKRFAELYELTPIDENNCTFTLHVGVDPIFPLSLTGPLGKWLLSGTFKTAPESLAKFMLHHKLHQELMANESQQELKDAV